MTCTNFTSVGESMVRYRHRAAIDHRIYRFGISMTPPYLDRMIPRMTENIMELVELWTLCSERMLVDPKGERAFSAIDDLRLFTLDIIASITFGTSFGSIKAAIDLLNSDQQ